MRNLSAREKAKESIVTFKSLIAERTNNFDEYMIQVRNAIQSAPAEEHERRGALAGFAESSSKSRDLMLKFNDAQNRVADAITAIFDYAERNFNEIEVNEGRLIFKDQLALDSYNSLIFQFQRAAEEEQIALSELQQFHKKGVMT